MSNQCLLGVYWRCRRAVRKTVRPGSYCVSWWSIAVRKSCCRKRRKHKLLVVSNISYQTIESPALRQHPHSALNNN